MQRLLTSLFALAIVFVSFSASTKPVEAATIPLSGYAWSETVGWVHFSGSNYGVLVDSSTGAMSGYAWSETLGWLSFNSAEMASCGSAPTLDIHTGVVNGWVKWLSSGECVHLKGSGYGVTYSSSNNEFSGYAWGDTDTGWLHFKGTNYVVTSGSPIVEPPGTPTGLTATAISTSQINLAWTDTSSGELGFKVERKTGSGGTYAQITQTNPNAESYNNTGLTAGTNYYYRVKATNNGGDSTYSNEANATTVNASSTISVSTTPSSASWTINPGNTSGTGSVPASVSVVPSVSGTTYTITPNSTPAGYDSNPSITNSVTGTGSSVTLFGGESVSFTIIYTKSFNYTLSNGGNVNVQKGGIDQFGQTTITKSLTAHSGASQAVDLSLGGVPSGVSYSFSNQGCQPDCSSTVTFTVTPQASAGTYPITITGSPLSKTTNFNLVVTNSPDMFVSCTHNPSLPQVGQTVTWTANITNPGAGAPYTFSWTGTNVPTDPAPTTQSFDITYSTTGSKNATATVRDRLSNVAVCSPAGQLNVGVNPTFEEF